MNRTFVSPLVAKVDVDAAIIARSYILSVLLTFLGGVGLLESLSYDALGTATVSDVVGVAAADYGCGLSPEQWTSNLGRYSRAEPTALQNRKSQNCRGLEACRAVTRIINVLKVYFASY